jgi:thiol-disulfide isomerase/thioredoxin
MASFQGKPLLLNFWATWCPPCIEELPLIDAFWRKNTAIGHQVVALAIDQPSAVRKFLSKQALGFPVGLAGLEGTQLAKSLGNAVGGLPFTVFFKADGSIWRQKMGQLTSDDLMQWRGAVS